MKKIIIFILFFISTSLYGTDLDIETGPFNEYKVRRDIKDTYLDNDPNKTKVPINKGWIINIEEKTDTKTKIRPIKFDPNKEDGEGMDAGSVKKFEIYEIENKDIPFASLIYKSGMVFNLLVVPFKYRFDRKGFWEKTNVNKTWSPSSSLGPAAGWRYGMRDIYANLMLFGGITSVPVSELNDEEVKTEFGFSWGFGIIFEFPDFQKFQIGIIAGKDYVDDWEYKGTWWLSFGIGYRFM